ncbi:penicillin acylase family protein [Thalassobacter stenotrophicus]|uniref:penicillin acylase family protein n=1 Tax=Thalassobacter stenotrophicus TaxID=266809 RepID=UPI0022A9CCAC|nr:penicillin acylase family protein [Thalassobacter stenotrophicus]UYP66767.1 penicillin acylase family protein [Thalassobacter stenotrophicus]
MGEVFRWTVRGIGVVFAVAALGLFLGYLLAARSLPEYDKRLRVAGLEAQVEIVRNTHNVPHILGETSEASYFGLGYVHAQDRLWQMMLMRRTAQGRLSELFGAETLRTDELLRRLDLYGAASRAIPAQDPETMAMLEAYAAGVNARIQQVNDEALGRGAPEYFLFPPQIAPWRPTDSLAVLKIMALQLAGHMEEEIARARAGLVLPSERLVDLHPDAPGGGRAVLPEISTLFPTLEPTQFARSDRPALWPAPSRNMAGASNAWAATPARAAKGGTLLANDPHLGLSAPSIWYLARLELATGGVIGGTVPGMPLVLVGRSEQIGWGLTSAYLDDQDVFIERLNPDNPFQYRTPDGWKDFEVRESIIQVKDADPVTITLRWTDNGPVLTRGQFDLGSVTPQGHVAALGWTALADADTSMRGAREIMAASTIDQALEAGRYHVAPAQNLTVVDGRRVAMQIIGHQPQRDINHQSQGRIPAPGWEPRNRWQGTMPYAMNPRFVDPAGGIVGNTNNKTVDQPFPRHISHWWGDTQRVQRWERLMQARVAHTRESFIEAQLDPVSISARALLPLIGRDLWFTGEAAAADTPERTRHDALTLLAAWNGEMSEHLPEPLIYAAWVRHLQDRLIRDELGPLADDYTHVEPLFIERVYRNAQGAAAWCDVIQSTPLETCADMARISLDEALIWLTERYGRTPASWRWGDAHEARHDHPVLGEVPGLSLVVNIRQSTSGGDNTLMRGLTSGEDPDPFTNVHAGAYRGVYDFSDPESSVFIISTGQSGHPLSRHYDDLGELWRRGEYIPMTLDPALARAGAVGVTVLEPAR